MEEVLILDGKKAKGVLTEKLKEKILSSNLDLKLKIFQVGDRPESNAYINSKIKFGESVGIKVDHIKLKEQCSFEDLKSEVEKANLDKKINGIIIQLPVPESFDKQVLLDLVSPEKDVDGLTSMSKDKRSKGFYAPIPATARGVFELLQFYQIDVRKMKVAVLGRSILAGGPIAEVISSNGGLVTVCHSKTQNEEKITRESDLVVVAIGKPKFIDEKFFVPNKSQIVVDVGINKVIKDSISKMQEEIPASSFVGDVDFEGVKDLVRAISPVPGGVGQMTVLALFENLFDLTVSNKN
jgi:methylenetetrahydrofolate dehydrogenase (NADP+)/methenyltetrahydrofolate cyclohydrolase